ncbi:aminotransferase class I/II-fold pyridoxal phosphate-dependent enzyme [uncultured Desulfobacter sp.]|uniref:trans-sulfuration enzyme family protein n=1 Tax=uncultured Desulfobacter sp. TaxID=240139 RepID=UPI002AAC1A91|nr:aminotransferase class I/II-fold pyridoxal phosphate-dependent enzyme [uncultured Desulfobacter sp.]
MISKELNAQSMCIHAGESINESRAVVQPIYQTSTFRFDSTSHGAALFAGRQEGYIYTRMGNPTIRAMEEAVATLEKGKRALGCGSGMAAVNTVFSAELSAGDHVVCSQVVYGPTMTLLNTVYKRFGVTADFVDTSDTDQVIRALKPTTRLVYIESPGNPTIELSDIQKIAHAAHNAGAVLAVDNTFLSPWFQNPLALGADIVIHSLTKFINGHADVIGGIVVVKDDETYKRYRSVLNQTGGVIDPFNAFLVHRGIKTLGLRMERHAQNGMAVARFLEAHPKIDWVRYPGLKSHPQYELGQRQHSGPGGVMAFELKGGFSAGETLLNSVEMCALAVSLGGVESLIQHPASMTHASLGKEQRLAARVTDGLIRLSVGIESCDDIIADLTQALDRIP